MLSLDSRSWRLNCVSVSAAPVRISDYMDLTPVDIVGRRCYQFIHAEDVEGIRQSHLDREYSSTNTRSPPQFH